MLVSGRISLKLTQPAKGFPCIAKYSSLNEKITTIICKFLDLPVKAIVTVDMHSLYQTVESVDLGRVQVQTVNRQPLRYAGLELGGNIKHTSYWWRVLIREL